ncbi:MAG TPA: ATP-binding protein [Woeseiaceae bacterium]|nr:ATP-binding protein [Woeseiaceae bacterium]
MVYDAGDGRVDAPDPRGRRLLVDTSLPVMNNVAGERKLDGAADERSSLITSLLVDRRYAAGRLSSRPRAIAVCLALLALASGAALVAERFLYVQNVLLVFLPVILFAAVRYGFWMALGCSVLSIASSSYFLADPRFSFAVRDPENIWALLFFLLVSAFTSTLAAQLRHRTAALQRSSRVTEELFAFSSTLAAISQTDDLLRSAARRLARTLEADVRIFVPGHEGLTVRGSTCGTGNVARDELDAARWTFAHGLPSGGGAGTSQNVAGLYLPLRTGRGTVGVIGLFPHERKETPASHESALLDSLANQVAINLERVQLAERMQETRILAEADKLRTALLTSISHDFKTPLASILGNVSSVAQYGRLYDEATRTEMLEMAEAETVRLSRFVDNLLHMTRIDAGGLHPTLETLDVSDLVGSALTRSEKLLQRHRLRTDLPADLPMVDANFVLAEHVLANLLDNAAKYSPPGSEIRIAAHHADDRVVMHVQDEGPGIPEEHLEQIFQRFFRVMTADHRPAGTGLGLAICRGFVEAMGGTICAANRTDAPGARFTITLPRSADTGEPNR